jgi:hypothetical protein
MAAITTPRPSPLRHWSGWLPLAIPVFFFLLGVRSVVVNGFVRQADEGTEAHLFQLLMPVQFLVMGYFGLAWVPRAPRQALPVLALQLFATVALFAALYWAEHTAPAA